MANAIMCCKCWLGFDDELAHQDMVQERKLAEEGLGAIFEY